MPKDLHSQPLVTTLANSDRIAAGVPGQVGAKNQLFGDLLNQIKSWLDIAYMAIFTKVNSYPEIPETPENKVLSDSGDWVTMATATGGFASNLYFSNADSDIVGYKTLSYTFTDTPIEVSTPVIVGDGDKLVASYLYGSGVATDIYPGGQWAFNMYVKIAAVVGTTNIGFRYFKYSTGGVKTFVFDSILWSDPITNTAYAYKTTGAIKGSFALDPTDRMGCDIYVKTSASSERTVTFVLGDGNASYLNNPNAIRHSLLRDKNGEAAFQHVTQGAQTFSGEKILSSSLGLTELAATPATPASGNVKIYPKTDGKLYKLDDTGVEVEVGAGASTHNDLTGRDSLAAHPASSIVTVDSSTVQQKITDIETQIAANSLTFAAIYGYYNFR